MEIVVKFNSIEEFNSFIKSEYDKLMKNKINVTYKEFMNKLSEIVPYGNRAKKILSGIIDNQVKFKTGNAINSDEVMNPKYLDRDHLLTYRKFGMKSLRAIEKAKIYFGIS